MYWTHTDALEEHYPLDGDKVWEAWCSECMAQWAGKAHGLIERGHYSKEWEFYVGIDGIDGLDNCDYCRGREPAELVVITWRDARHYWYSEKYHFTVVQDAYEIAHRYRNCWDCMMEEDHHHVWTATDRPEVHIKDVDVLLYERTGNWLDEPFLVYFTE